MCRPSSVARPRHNRGRRASPRATWTTRHRPAKLRRVPAPANDNRFKISRAGRAVLYALAILAILSLTAFLTR